MSDTSISVKVKNCFYCNFDAFISLTKFKGHIKVRRAYFISLLIFKYIISSMDFDFEMPYFFTEECSVYVRFNSAKLSAGLTSQLFFKCALLT